MVFYIHSSAQPVNFNFFKMLYEIDLLAKKQATVLITPYLPYARSNKSQRGVAITGRLVLTSLKAMAPILLLLSARMRRSLKDF